MPFKYDFAISFAGEVRKVARQLVDLLTKKGISVFYDEYNEGEMVGKKLSTYFQKQFGENSKYVIILISKEYPLKDWTNLELSIMRDEAKKRKSEFILPVRLDDTKLLGIHDDIGFIDFREKGLEKTVEILMEKLSIEERKDIKEIDTKNEKEIKDRARKLLKEVNKEKLSVVLPEFYDFLIDINEQEEIIWVEVEMTGKIYEAGKDDPDYFAYRGIRGHISPVKINLSLVPNLDLVIANPQFLLEPFDYIPSKYL